MDKPSRARKLASVRMSSGGYLAIAAVMTFVALICLRTHRDLPALIIVFTTWTTIPALMLTDRLTFDGLRLRRTGPGAFFFISRWMLQLPTSKAWKSSACVPCVAAAMSATGIALMSRRVTLHSRFHQVETSAAWFTSFRRKLRNTNLTRGLASCATISLP